MKKVCNTKGFTLVELIIVIAIVAVLAAVGIPAISSYVSKSVQATCSSNAQLIAKEGQRLFSKAEETGTAFHSPPTLNDVTSTPISVGVDLDKTNPMVKTICKSAGVDISSSLIELKVTVSEVQEYGEKVGYSIDRVDFIRGTTTGTYLNR